MKKMSRDTAEQREGEEGGGGLQPFSKKSLTTFPKKNEKRVNFRWFRERGNSGKLCPIWQQAEKTLSK